MSPQKPPSDVPEYGRIEPEKSMPTGPQSKPDAKAFESYMNEKAEKPEGQEAPSPLQLPSGKEQQAAIAPSIDTLQGQISETTTKLNDIKDKLQTPNLNLKNSHQKLLNTKLTEANDHLQKATEYLGTNEITPTPIPEDAGPVTKFLGYLTDGQNRLNQAKEQLKQISAKKGQLQPAEMMLIQINLSQAQQEIEFSSVLLSKVTDALKQTLSIQL